MITSENIFEVLIVYHYLKAALDAVYYHFELKGLRNMKISGADVNIQQDMVPKSIFHRTLTLHFFYEANTLDFIRREIVRNFAVSGTPTI